MMRGTCFFEIFGCTTSQSFARSSSTYEAAGCRHQRQHATRLSGLRPCQRRETDGCDCDVTGRLSHSYQVDAIVVRVRLFSLVRYTLSQPRHQPSFFITSDLVSIYNIYLVVTLVLIILVFFLSVNIIISDNKFWKIN
jgi:hypothetical protein